MPTLNVKKRETKTAGEINRLRLDGFIPAILYGGNEQNQKISLSKNSIKSLIGSENFLSNILNLDIEGKKEKVLPRDISFDPLSDEPIHIDFLRIIKGAKLILEIPVKFINSEKSPGLKKGGVLNIVRRKVELKCPTENIPNEIIVDLDNTEINTSLKISSVKLPENVVPTITDRDFVIATVVAPTILVEPEKIEETTVEGEAPAEGTVEDVEGAEKTESEKDKTAKPSDDKGKAAKPSDDKGKTASGEKGKVTTKEAKKK